MTALASRPSPGWSFDAAAADRRAPARYLLPVTSAACVLMIGAGAEAALGVAPFCGLLVAVSPLRGESVALKQAGPMEPAENASPVVAAADRLPFPPATFDCILVQGSPGAPALAALCSLLKPGGALGIICGRLPRLDFAAAGFARVRRYGSAPSRSDGAEYLSLDGTTGVSFYFRNVAQPSTFLEKLKTGAKCLLARFGFASALFRSFLIVAERKTGQC